MSCKTAKRREWYLHFSFTFEMYILTYFATNACYICLKWPLGASKTRRRGVVKGYKATGKRVRSGTQKLQIQFDALTGGVCGEINRTFVDEIVVFTRKRTPLIGVKSWKKVREVVKDSIVDDMMVSKL
jgi:hypothetical protein